MLKGRKILVGICGSIAAYKSIFLIRLLIREGAEVKVILTDSAHDFVTPVTLATLSKNPVMGNFIKDNSGTWHNHVELGLWADMLLIAPATANTMARSAHGHCDNLLSAVYLSARCPVWWAPAMDLDMYRHPSTRKNLRTLVEHGDHILEAESGELASGLNGQGRMMEPERILSSLNGYFSSASESTAQDFEDKKVLITAGPTQEAIDPVRFISNHSSGKMGYALAEELAARGASVQLVSGPVNLTANHPRITVHPVLSAQDMFEKSNSLFAEMDIAIFSAAVADYAPAAPSNTKIKKEGDELALILKKTPDIAASLSTKKGQKFLVGFALETDRELANAQSKLERKNLDMIVLNSLRDEKAGFGHDTNKVSIISRHGGTMHFDLKPKTEVAKDVVNELKKLMHA